MFKNNFFQDGYLNRNPGNVPSLKDWFIEFNNLINSFNSVDIFSEKFTKIAQNFNSLIYEYTFEINNDINRLNGSVYDRNDFIVREILRTNKIFSLFLYYKTISNALAQQKAIINSNFLIEFEQRQLSVSISNALLRDMPSIFALMFTASETIGIINIDDIFKILINIIQYILLDNSTFIQILTPFDIFSSILFVIKSCLNNLNNLNISLFFSYFNELNIFNLLIKIIIKSYNLQQFQIVDLASQCLSLYIQIPQSENDLNNFLKNSDNCLLYKDLMKNVIDKLIQSDRSNRSKFRSILHFSRNIK